MNPMSTDNPGESLISSISRSYTFCRSSSEAFVGETLGQGNRHPESTPWDYSRIGR